MTQVVYDFKKRVGDARKIWDGKVQSLIRKGADKNSAHYEIRSLDLNKMIVHIVFSKEITNLMPECLKHKDIQKIIKVLNPALFKITSDGIVSKGEEGLSALTHLIDRCCKKIEAILPNTKKKIAAKRQKKLAIKQKVLMEAKEVLRNVPHELVNLKFANDEPQLEVVFYKNRKRAYKRMRRMAKGMPERLVLTGKPDAIIHQLQKYIDAYK